MNLDRYHNYSGDGVKTPIKYVSILGSPAHTYGNALAYIENWLVNLFPKDFFKTFHVNSKLASRQLRSTKHEYLKKERPMLVLRPRIDFEGSEFLRGTPLTQRMSDTLSLFDYGALQPFFMDRTNGFEIRYQMNRYSMYVDVIIIYSTDIQAINMMHYLKEATRIEIPFNLQTCFESYIPSDLIRTISKIIDLPVKDKEGNTREFLKYMNQHSNFPITYKLQGSTGNLEFFRYYPVTIDTVITDLAKDEGENHDQITTHFQQSFTIKMEFNTSGMYFLFSNNSIPYEIDTRNTDDSLSPDTNLVPLFTDVVLKEDLSLQPGWNLWRAASIILEQKKERVDIKDLLNESIMSAVSFYLKNGLPIFEILDIKVRRQGKLLHYGEDYIIDYNTFEILFENESYGYYTYRILVCTNTEKINELIKNIYHLE